MTVVPIHFDEMSVGDLVRDFSVPDDTWMIVVAVHGSGRERSVELSADGRVFPHLRVGNLAAWARLDQRDASSVAAEFLAHFGDVDGSHHKQWVIDQSLRILMHCPVILESFDGYVATVYGASDAYFAAVGEDWDEGIAP